METLFIVLFGGLAVAAWVIWGRNVQANIESGTDYGTDNGNGIGNGTGIKTDEEELTAIGKRIKSYAIELGNTASTAKEVATAIEKWGSHYHVNKLLIAAIAAQESYLGKILSGDNGMSHGPMHVYKPTYEWIKSKNAWNDSFDALLDINIGTKYGTYYLNECIKKAMREFPSSDVVKIRKISAYLYNHGMSALDGKSSLEAIATAEGDFYVQRVMYHYNNI